MKQTISVMVEPFIAAFDPKERIVCKHFPTLAEAEAFVKKEGYGLSAGKVFGLRTENGASLDDAKGCYLTKEEAAAHLNEIAYSHCTEACDTEGHTYDCMHCDLHYYVFDGDPTPLPACTVQKVFAN